MEISKLFEEISAKMKGDFNISAQFQHHGNRGSYREDSLKNFLTNGKLPDIFGIASGEIISQYSQVSKQMDAIIYDKSKSIIFESSESTKIFPIESVLGIIEVKSQLSKAKLIEGLENIKSLKTLHAPQLITKNYGDRVQIGYYNNPPFGVIFAYSLSGNSLESLRNNLKEWCDSNPPEVWPNFICILDEGTINFRNGLNDVLISSEIKKTSSISSLQHKENSLFEFTSALITLCANREIDIFNIQEYKNIGIMIDTHRVKFEGQIKNLEGQRIRLSDSFIKIIYENRGKSIPYKDLMDKFADGLNFIGKELFDDRLDKVYVYDPDNLPSISELLSKNTGNKPLAEILQNTPIFSGGTYLIINEEKYYIPLYYWNENNTVLFE
ncbi:hypothetical protein F7P73_13670 [Acinetobacter bohemicus]|uniref:DUF6602 domain-containing protein n=1 Tax=Acinetobacter bohemicus TaxID=1435036 RepID=A0A1I6VGK9_9GAMM|nr:DUF6602 domain-containing protein [Acinetobacter bohemicus]KAB0651403.1 hypothetical protein F7P73_13670 [Acinetobacter bohemicus]SFT12614.1 hypothetical protein SAMN05444586_102538 [Acinetobacter bohemicus]